MIDIQEIPLSCFVVQSGGNVVSDMDGDTVMMSIDNGKYYNLGKVGGVIWDLIKESISVEQVVTILMSDYDIGRAECEKQVLSFMKHLYKEGLIRIEYEN